MDVYPGPYCEALKLNCRDIDEKNISVQCNTIKNGVILELHNYLKSDISSVIQKLCSNLKEINPTVLKTKIIRLVDTKRKCQHRKKVRAFKNLKDFLDADFHVVTKLKIPSQEYELICSAASDLDFNHKSSEKLADIDSQSTERDAKKSNNLIQYEISKNSKIFRRVLYDISCAKSEFDDLRRRIGHYSVKNVNKRHETHRKNLKVLRDSQRLMKKQNVQISSLTAELKQLQLKEQTGNEKGSMSLLEFKKKRVAQKAASYYKIKYSQLQQTNQEFTQAMDIKLTEKNATIQTLETEIEIMSAQINEGLKTKEKDGSFEDNLRMCVIELSGLEVATQKVSPVIMCVSKHLFGKELAKNDLPSSTTVQTIVDEGHFLAKKFISNEVATTDHWGLNRDGTTRRKQKIVDTSITLSSGSIISLGFNRVSKETAKEIHNVTKVHLMELANVHNINNYDERLTGDYVKSSLQKLAFCMSDRASNEKKASQLLSEWREELLKDENIDTGPILSFYCMAHILLGFHTYSCRDLREYEKTHVNEHGQLGRDTLPVFYSWKNDKSKTILERVVRTTSDVFGPAGDHYGIRDLWEGFCRENGVKSVIGNYRDNRFNALFQTSAEVLLHRHQFLEVLEMVKHPNLKLKAVKADLKSEFIATMLQCFGLIYLKITGPFWNLITKSDVSYLELYRPVQDIYRFLEDFERDPSNILHSDYHWTECRSRELEDILNVPNRASMVECLFNVHEDRRRDLLACLKLAASAMKQTVMKQLADFLPGGKFCEPPSDKELCRTKYAQTTNLGCEHHFGNLDHSQRRRPSASMHHHSSVQLLKRNGPRMMKWLHCLSLDHRRNIMKGSTKRRKNIFVKNT